MVELFGGNLVEISLITIIGAGLSFLAVEIIGIGCLSVMIVVLISAIILFRRRWQVIRQKGSTVLTQVLSTFAALNYERFF